VAAVFASETRLAQQWHQLEGSPDELDRGWVGLCTVLQRLADESRQLEQCRALSLTLSRLLEELIRLKTRNRRRYPRSVSRKRLIQITRHVLFPPDDQSRNHGVSSTSCSEPVVENEAGVEGVDFLKDRYVCVEVVVLEMRKQSRFSLMPILGRHRTSTYLNRSVSRNGRPVVQHSPTLVLQSIERLSESVDATGIHRGPGGNQVPVLKLVMGQNQTSIPEGRVVGRCSGHE
jgi:hypothetical protein